MNDPYGGKLVKKIVPAGERSKLLKDIDQRIAINTEIAKDVVNITNGLYSSLEGFMNKDDFVSVVENKKLANGLTWTIPVYLTVSAKIAGKLTLGSQILLTNKQLELQAVLILEDKFSYNIEKYCKNIYGSTDMNHPGVLAMHSEQPVFIGGEVYLLDYGKKILPEYNLTPEQTRKVFSGKGWKTVVGFQTRNPAHLAHEFTQKAALEFVDGLFINPIIGQKKKGDFRDEVILSVYEMLARNFYYDNTTFLSIYPARMRYAGPREAVFHAIVRKNYGCTHFIVGRDHAGVNGFYEQTAAQKIFDEIEDIGIQIMKFSNAFYAPKLRMFTTEKVSPFVPKEGRIDPSGTEIRKMVAEKNVIELEKFMRKEVVEIILGFKNPFVS